MSFQIASGANGTPSCLRELVVLAQIRLAANDAAGHRPFVDAELQHEQHVDAP